MNSLFDYLKKNGYKKVRFKISKTNHLTIKANINDIKGDFILDTGASSSCISDLDMTFFNLLAEESDTKATGAGGTGIQTQISKNNVVKLGNWKSKKIDLIVLDLSHVNQALLNYNSKTIHGIIGADILQDGKAIIDYDNQYLYLIQKK